MANEVNQILEDACTNGFSCLGSLRLFDIALAELLYEITINGGAGGSACLLCGEGDPVDPPPTGCTCADYTNLLNSQKWYWDNRVGQKKWYKFG